MQLPDLCIAGNRIKTDIEYIYDEVKIAPIYKGKKYFLRTYGCQMNVHDSESSEEHTSELQSPGDL